MNKFVPVLLRGYNNYDVKAASDEAGTLVEGPSMTQQHFAEECDINNIVARYGLLGELPVNVKAPVYGDFTGVSDYRSALHQIMEAEDSFMQMPAKVRARFENDPGQFVDFCSDPANREEAKSLGLLLPDPVVVPDKVVKVEVVGAPTPSGSAPPVGPKGPLTGA